MPADFPDGTLLRAVVEVTEGVLAEIPESSLPRANAIPGSLAFPPLNDEFGTELGKHFVVRTEQTTRVVSRGKELRSITLRGWLHPLPAGFETNSEPGWDDWHYWLELDSAWAAVQWIDLTAVLRIGNVTESTMITWPT